MYDCKMRDARQREIGKRFRQVAPKINWESLRNSFLPLQEAYEFLQRPAKLAGQEGLFSRDEKIDAVLGEAKSQGGRLFRAAYDLSRQLSIDSDRDRFRAQLKSQSDPLTRLSSRDIEKIIGPKMVEAELGARLVSTMDTLLSQLRDPVESRHQRSGTALEVL